LISVIEATKDGSYLLQLLNEFSMVQQIVKLFSNSSSTIHLVENQAYSCRTKHINARGSFLVLEEEQSKIKFVKVSALFNPSDMMTKSFPKDKLSIAQA